MSKRYMMKAQPPLEWFKIDGVPQESACQDLYDNKEKRTICQLEAICTNDLICGELNKLNDENEYLKEKCLDIVNIISDARRELFEDKKYAADEILSKAIDKLQEMSIYGEL